MAAAAAPGNVTNALFNYILRKQNNSRSIKKKEKKRGEKKKWVRTKIDCARRTMWRGRKRHVVTRLIRFFSGYDDDDDDDNVKFGVPRGGGGGGKRGPRTRELTEDSPRVTRGGADSSISHTTLRPWERNKIEISKKKKKTGGQGRNEIFKGGSGSLCELYVPRSCDECILTRHERNEKKKVFPEC